VSTLQAVPLCAAAVARTNQRTILDGLISWGAGGVLRDSLSNHRLRFFEIHDQSSLDPGSARCRPGREWPLEGNPPPNTKPLRFSLDSGYAGTSGLFSSGPTLSDIGIVFAMDRVARSIFDRFRSAATLAIIFSLASRLTSSASRWVSLIQFP
jgi:hypothetical protein